MEKCWKKIKLPKNKLPLRFDLKGQEGGEIYLRIYLQPKDETINFPISWESRKF
jgi:hypothetical protein